MLLFSLGAAALQPAVEPTLSQRSIPLVAAASTAEAAEALQANGVVRVDGVLSRKKASALKQRIFDLKESAARQAARVSITGNEDEARSWNLWLGAVDNRFVPGTRVQFSDAVEKRLTAERSDVLLPLEDGIVADGLRDAASALQDIICAGAASLPIVVDEVTSDGAADVTRRASARRIGERLGSVAPPPPPPQPEEEEQEEDGAANRPLRLEELELVECGSLIAMPGAVDQALHADYRRDNVLVTARQPGTDTASLIS